MAHSSAIAAAASLLAVTITRNISAGKDNFNPLSVYEVDAQIVQAQVAFSWVQTPVGRCCFVSFGADLKSSHVREGKFLGNRACSAPLASSSSGTRVLQLVVRLDTLFVVYQTNGSNLLHGGSVPPVVVVDW